VVLAAVIVVGGVGPIAGYVWINEFGRRACPPAQKQTAADLYNLISAHVTSTAVSSGPGICDGDDPNPQVVAAFDGPITETNLMAAYRQHAAEVGWREGSTVGTLPLCFDGALTDGTPFKVGVWSDEQVTAGTIPRFFVTGFYSGGPMGAIAGCGIDR
jgi:hypothetical protein